MFNAKRMILNVKAKLGIRTTKELAAYVQVPAVTIRNMECNNNPTIRTLSTIAGAADIELDELVKMGVIENEQ